MTLWLQDTPRDLERGRGLRRTSQSLVVVWCVSG